MSSVKTCIIVNNAVNYKGVAYPHEAFRYRNGERLLVEEVVDVRTEEKTLVVYDEDEEVLCEIALGQVTTIGELDEAF